MRFTRNFLLLAALLVIVSGIGASSLWLQRLAAVAPGSFEGELTPGAVVAVAEEKALDRNSLIASLRALLPDNRPREEVAIPKPTEEPVTASTTEEETVREISWCDATVLESAIAARWPASLEVVVEEGARIARVPGVVSTDPLVPSVPPQPVLQLPLYGASGAENCLTHAYVGVTPSGRLIHNNDVILYTTYSAADLVGYALDGNPIYGPNPDVTLDACGGVATAAGYQYHVRTDEPFILACFSGDPATVTGG